ncbi:MAG: aldehyde dehydrogenase family protein [Phycisphaerales bacterium]
MPLTSRNERTVWSSTPLDARLAWVVRFRRLVAANELQLCRLVESEVHRPRAETLFAEVAPLLSGLAWLEDASGRLLRDREVPGSPWWKYGARAIERRVPMGRVGIIATWSHPLLGLGTQIAHALAAGNSVVVKPSEKCPKTHTRLLELAIEAGLPPGVLSWTGATREAGANMLQTQSFDHVVFTGSAEVGERISQTLVKTMTPATLSFGGRDSVFVLEDADARRAARAVWGALNLHGGQTAISPRRVLVLDKVYEKFIKELIRLASKAGDVDLIDEAASQRCRELVSKALGRGARDAGLLTPMPPKLGSNIPREEPTSRFRVTALIDCEAGMEVVEGKHYGALTAVLKCANLEEAVAIHNRCDQHASVSIFTRKPASAAGLASRLHVSAVLVNDCVLPMTHPGVGGATAGGQGVIGGEEGLLAMTRPVTLTVSRYEAARYAGPIAQWKVEWAARLLRWWYEAGRAQRQGLGKVLPSGVSTLATAPTTEADRALAGTIGPAARGPARQAA